MLHGRMFSLAFFIFHSIKSTLMTIYFLRHCQGKFRLGFFFFSLNFGTGFKNSEVFTAHTQTHIHVMQMSVEASFWSMQRLVILPSILVGEPPMWCATSSLFHSCARLLFLSPLHYSTLSPSFLLSVIYKEMWWNFILGYANFGSIK